MVEKVTGTGFAHVFEQKVFGRIGAERDAFYATDPHGKAVSGGGLNITARDALRLAVMMSREGNFNGQQIVPAAVVAENRRRKHAAAQPLGQRERRARSLVHVAVVHRPFERRRFGGGHPWPDDPLSAEEDIAMVLQSSYPDADGAFFVVLDNFFAAVSRQLQETRE